MNLLDCQSNHTRGEMIISTRLLSMMTDLATPAENKCNK